MRLPKDGHWSEMITYDYAVCEICGKHYQSVSSHIRQAHGITNINEYKDEYGYNHNQPLESGRLQEKRSESNGEGYKNLQSEKYAFKKGHKTNRKYNQQQIEKLVEMGRKNSKDKEITAKRSKTLSKTIRERAIRDDKGRITGFKKK